MVGGLAAALGLVLFVVAHEAGHFLAAKAVGMKVTEFFVGFGPRVWSIRRGETEYGFKWIPLGGYVRIIGMNPHEPVDPSDWGRTYRDKRFWAKTVVVLAGVAVNLLLAFIMFYTLALLTGYGGEPTSIVDTTVAESPAADVELENGDRILQIGPHRIGSWDDVKRAVSIEGPGQTQVLIERGGQIRTFVIGLGQSADGSGFLGVHAKTEAGPIGSMVIAGEKVGETIQYTLRSLGAMLHPVSLAQYLGVFRGDTNIPTAIRPVSPIGIVGIGTQTHNIVDFVAILATINVVLATINLVPLPPLDGGHFAVALYEKVTKRVSSGRYLIPVALAVVAVFAFLGLTALVLDLTNPINV